MDRREFIAYGASALLKAKSNPAEEAQPVVGASSNVQALASVGKTNIVMIMADQLRQDCVGVYGNRVIRTPHLDRLGNEGIIFEQAYSSTPSCTPARSALMTGMSPWKHGMLGYSNIATNPYPVEKARALSEAGYFTMAVGKNHYYPITNPHGYNHMVTDEHCSYWFDQSGPQTAQSYEPRCDYESWFWSQMPDKDPHKTGLGWNDRTAKPFVFPEEMHATYWTGTTAVRFLEQYERKDPFFLKVSFIRPHSPYDPPERFFKMYEKADLPKAEAGEWAVKYEPRSSERDDLWHGKLSDEMIRNSRQGYYGSVSFMDEQVGRILEVLERRGILESTLIVFFSDHGDMLGDQNMWRKSYAYEQSAHIPMLMRVPKSMGLRRGQRVEGTVELRDVLPTFLEVAGVDAPKSMDGRSMLELVRNGKEGWREYLDLEHDLTYDRTNHWTALTDGRWKYIFHAFDGQEQLFDLKKDPNELNDLVAKSSSGKDLAMWRGRMVEHLRERGPEWVEGDRLMLRPKSMLHSPNFPGYVPMEKIAGWR
ncbi:MAG: arylsulfatase [Edaphobacter sp.]|uniref:arylsulfatase n=1 Tax=Edaphobacter sp. TaxID=1934404 RepID=UPI0023955899|nr:arylsulfatase [Edaphobacter sp.]MDE1177906.1 arylsulfatase [Edaphobacter sp.]